MLAVPVAKSNAAEPVFNKVIVPVAAPEMLHEKIAEVLVAELREARHTSPSAAPVTAISVLVDLIPSTLDEAKLPGFQVEVPQFPRVVSPLSVTVPEKVAAPESVRTPALVR